MSAKRQFTVIGEEEVQTPLTPAQEALAAIASATAEAHATIASAADANRQILLIALRALSQRALTAISDSFTLLLVASVWWLWSSVLANPTLQQIETVGGYAAFCLAIEFIRRGRRPS